MRRIFGGGSSAPVDWLVVGLGNPGERYARTPHNVGFAVADELALRLDLDRVLVVHDEIDLPFGEIRTRIGGGLAGHNGLKSLRRGLGSPDFARVRVGVGRPDSTDPDIVSAYVLGRWRQPAGEVRGLVERAADAAEDIVLGTVAP